MVPADDVTSQAGDYCLAKVGETYAIYLPKGQTTSLDLSAATGTFSIRWYNPRAGGELVTGSVRTVNGGGLATIGLPPEDPDLDWVALVVKQ